MEEKRLELLHRFLFEIVQANDENEVKKLTDVYSAMDELNKSNAIKQLISDINAVGNELVLLRGSVSARRADRIAASLSENEQKELSETNRIIDQNLFKYHFQPIVNTIDGEIYSYEALMRPESKVCPSPLQIIKYAELAERLDDIERATFMNILGIIDEKTNLFENRRVFINSIPKTRLTESDFTLVRALMEKHAETVVVEMTEQSEIDDGELGKIRRTYQEIGIDIAVDDFGTGYSNIQNLIRYMPQYVKIDRSLISGIHEDRKKRHFVRDIIDFCHENGIMALAEGVETYEELHTVILMGADLIQGYYTAKPSAEIIDSIPKEIRLEIKRSRQEREDGKKLSIYTAESNERISADRLSKENYKCILIGKKSNGDVTVVSEPALDTGMHIRIADGFKGTITLENTVLSNINSRPCIELGENCDVKLIATGANNLKKSGIRVPESSRFTLSGDGGLVISVDGSAFYGVGNDENSKHGELIFEQGITINNNSASGICIGSGLGGKIRITGGQHNLNMRGYTAVGIGAFNADTELEIFACDINMDLSIQLGSAIGSFEGNTSMSVLHSSVKCYLSGKDVVGIGTINGKECRTSVNEAAVVFDIAADNCSAVGALNGSTFFNLSQASMHITAKGVNALAIGGCPDSGKINLYNSDSYINLESTSDYMNCFKKEQVVISGGRSRFTVNNTSVMNE